MNLIANQEYPTPDLMIYPARAAMTPTGLKQPFWQRAAAELRGLTHQHPANPTPTAADLRASAIARAAALEILG